MRSSPNAPRAFDTSITALPAESATSDSPIRTSLPFCASAGAGIAAALISISAVAAKPAEANDLTFMNGIPSTK